MAICRVDAMRGTYALSMLDLIEHCSGKLIAREHCSVDARSICSRAANAVRGMNVQWTLDLLAVALIDAVRAGARE